MALHQLIISLFKKIKIAPHPRRTPEAPSADLKARLSATTLPTHADTIHTGPKGGQYRIGVNGQKIYLKQPASQTRPTRTNRPLQRSKR